MDKIVKKKSPRFISQIYLDKVSGMLRDRWKETQQAIKSQHTEENLFPKNFN